MKILYAYICSKELFPVLLETLALQKNILNEDFQDKVIFTNFHFDSVECKVVDIAMDEFNFAKFKNVVFHYAIDNDYDWLLLLGADTIMAKLPTIFPETGFAASRTIFQKEGEKLEDIKDKFETAIDSSFYLIGKEVFSRHFANEDFICMCHHEDWEWHVRLGKAGVHQSLSDFIVIHVWHPVRVLEDEFKFNKRVYERLTGK